MSDTSLLNVVRDRLTETEFELSLDLDLLLLYLLKNYFDNSKIAGLTYPPLERDYYSYSSSNKSGSLLTEA